MQDDIARLRLAVAKDDAATYRFTSDEAAEQDAADAEEARGDYASEAEVAAIWSKHGL